MPDTTRLTEIVTGLGMLGGGFRDTLPARPGELRYVDDDTWASVVAAWDDPALATLADAAFANGRFFLVAADALRGRRPLQVEWAGPRRAPGDEVAPVDLRIDHVYLVSCKYLSKITVNASPSHLFDRLLTGGHGRRSGDWYAEVAPLELADLWAAARRQLGHTLPVDVTELTKDERRAVSKQLAARTWPPELSPAYETLCGAVAERSARRWQESIDSAGPGAAEAVLWRLLRVGSAPYFVLGSHGSERPLRLRVASPWDWRRSFQLRQFEVTPLPGGQPMVKWRAVVRDLGPGNTELTVEGHVEIRWSHGRFSGPPEAKVYLDTPFENVPGYWTLT